jgi:hypothetical protein
MDEEIERLVVSVRADTGAFARDVAAMREALDGPFADGLERAGARLENALIRAVRTGKFGFEDLKATILAMMGDIAAAAIRGGISAATGGGGIGGLLSGLLGGLLGAPGRRRADRWRRGAPSWSASAGRSCSCRRCGAAARGGTAGQVPWPVVGVWRRLTVVLCPTAPPPPPSRRSPSLRGHSTGAPTPAEP